MSLAFYFLRVAAGLIGGLLYAVKSVRRLARAT
jgi:xanthosine utilization system XapX-like protein